ncbi:MAG: DnaJ domain-containing protein [Bacteroidetes bacterium]|nr:DnaJ domain-containing protein [Bacteroidota bacterium]MBS1630370.1 DnaJ domain-containing protein [Bacteroidota bacterium]
MPSDTDFFVLFGITPTLSMDTTALRKKFYELSRQYHPDRIPAEDQAAQTEALSLTAQLNIAYRTLSDEDALLGYALRREGVLQEDEHYQLPPDFLMEMMELNEALETDSGKRAFEEACANWAAGIAPLRLQYEHGERNEPLLKGLKDFYFRKKYLNRITGRLA